MTKYNQNNINDRNPHQNRDLDGKVNHWVYGVFALLFFSLINFYFI